MSEYQYYEFRAIERPLTNKQVGELRRYSSRADITATSFSVEYNWGDFKGDPHQWMEKYFDAFVHVANWGTRWFMVRIPALVLAREVLSEYYADDFLEFDINGGNLILSFRSEEDGDWVDDEGWMSSLIALRADLMKAEVTAEISAATQRRIIIYELLYAVGALLCVFNTYLSITFIVLLQLNSVFAPRIPLLDRV